MEQIVTTIFEAAADLKALATGNPHIPVLLHGAPGVGKTAAIESLAHELGIGYIDLRLAQMEPSDLGGIPIPNGDTLRYLRPDRLPMADRDGEAGILVLEEVTAARTAVQVAAYSLVLERRLPNCDYHLPDKWMVVATGNDKRDRAGAGTMSSALANRFLHYTVGVDVPAWSVWANAHGIRPEVTAFINARPNLLHSMKDQDVEFGWPSPRSWENVSKLLNAGVSRQAAIAGLIGPSAAAEFRAFVDDAQELALVRTWMADDSVPIEIPQKSDRKYAIAVAMSYHVWHPGDDASQDQLLNGWFRILEKLDGAFSALAITLAYEDTNAKEQARKASVLYRHPKSAGFKAKFAEMNKIRSFTI
jgi:MoxR-like ATPase